MKTAGSVLLLLAAMTSISSATAQWSPVTAPGQFDQVEVFLPGPDRLYAGTILGQVYDSRDHGATWTVVGSDIEQVYAPVVDLAHAGDWLLVSRDAFNGQLNLRSHFQDGEWSPWEPLDFQDSPLHSFAVLGQSVFAVVPGAGVRQSIDFGASWTAVNAPAGIAKVFTHDGLLFASTHQINAGHIYRTDDLGQSWVEIGQGLGSSYICSDAFWRGRLLLCVYHMGGVGTFWSTQDHGGTWEHITTMPTPYNINGMAVSADGRLAIGASSGYPDHQSMWLTADLVGWEDYTGNLPQFAWPFNDLVAHDGWFFKTGGTVTAYRAQQPAASGVDDASQADASVTLRAFPNPFRRETSVSLDFPRKSSITLDVFDAAGSRVATLFQGTLAAGTHHLSWRGLDDSGRLVPSGAYFIRFAGGGPGPGRTAAPPLILVD